LAHVLDLKNKNKGQKPMTSGPEFWYPKKAPQTPKTMPHDFEPELYHKPPPAKDSKGPSPRPETSRPETKVVSWSGPLYHHRPDMRIIIAVSLALFAIAALIQIFQKNIISTIFFGLLGVVVLIGAGKKPRVADFEINPLGVKVEERLYGFRDIKSFWIEYDPALGIKELSLQLKKWYSPYIKIPIDEQNPVQLRLILLAFLPEVEHQDTIADTVSRRLGI
jgi:hypothetical protein